MNLESFLRKLSILLYSTIIIFIIGDVLRKAGIFFDLNFIRYTAIAKIIILFAYCSTIIVFFKQYYNNVYTRKLIYLTFFLLAVFLIGQITLKDQMPYHDRLYKNALWIGRYLYWPLTAIVFLPLFTNKDYNNQHLLFYEKIFIVNAFVILLSFLFNVDFFKTYDYWARFGYMGFFNTANQASYYFILFILFYYYKGVIKKEGYIKLLFILIVSLLIGTKKIYLFLSILGIYHIISLIIWKKRSFYIQSLVVIILFLSFFSNIRNYLYDKFGLFIRIYHESGFLSSLTSRRNEILIETINNTILKCWRIPNYFLGGPRFYESRTELGLVDLYIFFGVFGVFAYYILFKLLFDLTKRHRFFLFMLVSIGIVVFFAEGFLSSANQPVLFIMIWAFFINEGNFKKG